MDDEWREISTLPSHSPKIHLNHLLYICTALCAYTEPQRKMKRGKKRSYFRTVCAIKKKSVVALHLCCVLLDFSLFTAHSLLPASKKRKEEVVKKEKFPISLSYRRAYYN